MESFLSEVVFDDLEVGVRHGPYTEWVSASAASRLAGEIGEVEEVSFAPPAMIPVLFLKALRSSMGGIPANSALAKQQVEIGAPIPVDQNVHTTTWVEAKYVRRDRPFVVLRFEITLDDGVIAGAGSKTIMWPTGPGERR